MFFTDDPIADAERYTDELEESRKEMLERLPRGECCGEPIEQEQAIYYNDQWCCENCEFDFWQDIREDFIERVRS